LYAKKPEGFQLKGFIEVLVENRWIQLATTVFAVISPLGVVLGYVWIFWTGLGLFIAGLFYAVIQEYHILKIYRRDFVPVPVVINISNPADSKNALNSVFSLIENDDKNQYRYRHKENLEKIFHIKEDDLIFEFKGSIENKENLIDFLKIVRHDIGKLESKIPAKDEFYLIYIGPVSVAVLVGAIFATSAVMILQYDKSVNGYNKVHEIRDRSIKENVKSFEKLDLKRINTNKNDSKNAVLAIDISSHKIDLNQLHDDGDIFYLKARNNNGTLSKDEDWGLYVKEIFKELNELQGKYEEVKLIYSMPVSIGLMLGVAIQNYWKIMLTQYADGSYKDLLRTNDIKYYF